MGKQLYEISSQNSNKQSRTGIRSGLEPALEGIYYTFE